MCQHHYDGLSGQIPPEILCSTAPADDTLLEEFVREQRGSGVRLYVPSRGKPSALAHAALQTARASLSRRLSGERTEEETSDELMNRLGLPKPPRVIECVDISNIMGVLAVGSLVRFEDGQPDKSGYRLFRIRTVEGSNDFAMMREVLMRRFRPGAETAREHPDLLIVDGGKGQLGVAEDVFRELNITEVELAGMAKSRLKVRPAPKRLSVTPAPPPALPVQPTASDDAAPDTAENDFFPDAPNYTGDEDAPADPVTVKARQRFRTMNLTSEAPPAPDVPETVRYRTEERIFLPGRKNPVTFARNSPALFLLERIRDETHRTAITYHRKLRQKTNRRSMLDEIPGVGPKRKTLLLKHFGSLSALRAATLEEISMVDGVSSEAARNVHSFLHPSDSPPPPDIIEVEEEIGEEDNLFPSGVPDELLDPSDRRAP